MKRRLVRIVRLIYRDIMMGLMFSKAMLLSRLIQPILWIFVAGFVFGGLIPYIEFQGKQVPYILWVASGIVMVQIMVSSIIAGAMLWADRRLKMFEQIMMGPFTRSDYILSKIMGLLIQGLLSAMIVLLIAYPVLLELTVTLIGIAYISYALLLASIFFGSLALIISALVKTQEAFNSVLNMMISPLMFLSSAFYPINLAPSPIRLIASLNPLTHATNIFRSGLLGIESTLIDGSGITLLIESFFFFLVAVFFFRRVKIE